MNDLRTAAQQALEYMKSIGQMDMCPEDWAIVGRLEAALAQQAEPTVKESLPVESVVAENATTQQQIEQTPPSDYRRGYWAGFAIGKREGRIEAEDEPAQQAEPVEPVAWIQPDHLQKARVAPFLCRVEPTKRCADFVPFWTAPPQQAEPVQEPVAWQDTAKPTELVCAEHWENIDPVWHSMYRPLYTAPPQRKPLTEEEIPALAEKVLKLSVYYDVWALLGTDGLVALVRAVEQAHGIKE